MSRQPELELPADATAEAAVLGAVLVSGDLYPDAERIISDTRYFTEPRNRAVWRAIGHLARSGRPVDLVLVAARLRQTGEYEQSGGAAYLASLADQVPRLENLDHYARLVRGAALKRLVMRGANRLLVRCAEPDSEPGQLAAESAAWLARVAESTIAADDQPRDVGDTVVEVIERAERLRALPPEDRITGIMTGIGDFDRLTCGLQPSDLVILAARPSAGKSAFALQTVLHAAERGARVSFVSLEMSRQQLVQRALAHWTGVPLTDIVYGNTSDGEHRDLCEAGARLAGLSIKIDDRPGLSTGEIGLRARAVEREMGGLDLLVVDYLQLVEPDRRAENRTQAVGQISRGLKALAKRLAVPVLALAQMSRAIEHRAERRPQLSDLRESGDLEADADLVVFLHRATPGDEGACERELILEKHRQGPTGVVPLVFWGAQQRFGLRTREPREYVQ